jgi:hypothetical protein
MAAIRALVLLATHATALAQALVAAAPSPATRIALMVGAALVGAVVGLIPAVLLGSALGVVPRPTRARLAPGDAERPEQPRALAAPEPRPPAQPRSEPVGAARARHRELYEAEYSWQELKLHALRQRIGAELGNRAPGATGDPAPHPGGLENPPKAGSTG